MARLAAELADATIENKQAILRSNKQEITVLNEFDTNAIRELKREGKIVAVKITIKGKQDENNAVKAAEIGADYMII